MTGRHLSDLISGRTGGALLMPWARIDDAFDDHPKVLALLDNDQGGAAVGLWTLCLTWAHRNTRKKGKIPGRLPASLPRRYLGPPARELAALLVKEELWEARDDGWQIHDFDQYLPTEETSAARAEAGRKGAEARWGKPAGRDGNLPSDDGKPMAADGSRDGKSADPADADAGGQDEPPADGNEPSVDSKLPFDDGKPMASDGSRARARWAIPNGIAPTPGPTPEGQDLTAAQKRRRATRIPDDFTADAAMVAWARERVPQVDGRTETEKFVNYWRAKSGRDATKLDWVLTWKNWMLTAAERTGKPAAASPPLPGVSPRDEHRFRR